MTLLTLVRASGLQPDTPLVNVLIGACAAAGEMELAQRIAWDMIKQVKETYHMAKETYHMAKETYHMAKET